MMEDSVEYVLVWRDGKPHAVEASKVKSKRKVEAKPIVEAVAKRAKRKVKLHPMSEKISELLDLGYKVKDVAKQLNLRYYDVYRVKVQSEEKA